MWTSDCLKTAVAFALALFILCACKPSGSGKSQVVKSADGKFQITVPDGWDKKSPGDVPNEIIRLQNVRLEAGLIVTAKQKADFETGMTLDKYTDMRREAQLKNKDMKDATQPEALSFNGHEARRYEITIDDIPCIVTAIESSENFHRIMACAPMPYFKDNKAMLKQISESFRAL